MTLIRRIHNLMLGLLQIALAVLLVTEPELGYPVIILILSLTLIGTGLHDALYYVSMAKNMVGGKTILYQGVILFDLGLFTLSISDVPRIYVILYVLAIHAVGGGIDVMRSMEAKRLESGAWRFNLAIGIANILMAVTCLFGLQSERILIWTYGSGLAYSGALRFASAFRRTAIAYIQ